MSTNWLQGLHHHADEPTRSQAMPVFAGQKLVVVGGSSGMGRQTAADVVAAGGSAVIIGQGGSKVDDTVRALAKEGTAWGITADLADRDQVEGVRQQLAAEHADATLLVNAAGFFIPKLFLDHDGAAAGRHDVGGGLAAHPAAAAHHHQLLPREHGIDRRPAGLAHVVVHALEPVDAHSNVPFGWVRRGKPAACSPVSLAAATRPRIVRSVIRHDPVPLHAAQAPPAPSASAVPTGRHGGQR